MTSLLKKFLCSTSIVFFLFSSNAFSQNLDSELDKIISATYVQNEPGATFLVAKNGEPIYRKAYGSSNLELGVDMIPENVFEIGSITKQFTAISILMLEEQGKLNIEDEITKFISDYPTHGKTITIHHLLNHTSGIKSYTSMPFFMSQARTDMSPKELIDYFKDEPMDFEPGEKFLYNNSGYILLGYIIEKVSGMSYEDFIEKNIFQRIDMNNSYYGSMKEIIKNRASGYQQNDQGYVNADYLSLSLPYAAGSIMSTVDDLLKWQNALDKNLFVKRETLNKAINGSKLNDGTEIPYGYGWGKNEIQGSTAISHSGGIFGYTTNGIYLPEEKTYIIGLSNCNCKNIAETTVKIAAAVLGKPFPSISDAVSLNETQLKKWVGTYEFKDQNTYRYITFENGSLMSQREGSTKLEIYPLSSTRFIFDGGMTEYEFSDNNGVKEVAMSTQNGVTIGVITDKALPKEKKEIAVSSDILETYVGTYQIQAGFDLVVTLEDGKLMTQATGQNKIPIFAEDETTFFAKVMEASLIFNKDENDVVDSVTLLQGGQNIKAKKIK